MNIIKQSHLIFDFIQIKIKLHTNFISVKVLLKRDYSSEEGVTTGK